MKVDRGGVIDETMKDLAARVGRKLRDEGWRCAGNRGEEAVALLEAYVRSGSEDANDGEYRQFAQRLQRYVLHGET